MRVAILGHNAQTNDAVGLQLAAKARFARARQWEVRVFVESDLNLHTELAGVAEVVTADSLWRDPPARRFLQAADVVFAEYGQHYPLLDLLPALRQGTDGSGQPSHEASHRPAIVLSYYGVTPARFWPKGQRRCAEEAERQRLLAWCADFVLAPSRFAAAELCQATGYPRERVRLLPCFVQTPDKEPAAADVRRQLGVGNAFVLLHVGRIAPNKRLPVAIEALARLRDLDRPAHLVAIGPSGEAHADEAKRCRRLAEERGVAGRCHLLGVVPAATLAAWYRSANVLVSASRHESFCLPIVEAMAAGLPVVAARAAALPETLGNGGLTFAPDDAEDLAAQIRRLAARDAAPASPLDTPSPVPPAGAASGDRVAIVSPRYGDDFAGGAEASLRTIAHALTGRGLNVEVFTTCNRHDWNWANHLPAGTTQDGPLAVHRFPIDPPDRDAHLAALAPFLRRPERVASPEEEEAYLRTSLHSTPLVTTLAMRRREFRAILAGPYLFGLTWSVARRLHERVLLVPCFHDEPLARINMLREAYRGVGGVLYHSPEEQRFAEADLAVNHPCSGVIGTLLNPRPPGAAAAGRSRCGEPYVVYCGRYSEEKGVNRLLAWAERYSRARPQRGLRFVFMGQGQPITAAPWVTDLGFVDAATKREVLAGARALIQLSTRESLSLVVLEAWAAGVPVIGHRDCDVVRGQIERAGGGWSAGTFEEFAAALDAVLDDAAAAAAKGAAGRAFVAAEYADPRAFTDRIVRIIAMMAQPPAAVVREQGLRRAAAFRPERWNERFGLLTADAAVRERSDADQPRLDVAAVAARRAAALGEARLLVPVRIHNTGSALAAAAGPAAILLKATLSTEAGEPLALGAPASPLSHALPPGQTRVALAAVALPGQAGAYRLRVAAEAANGTSISGAAAEMELVIRPGGRRRNAAPAEPLLEAAQSALAEAAAHKDLPDDYEDPTQGVLAPMKKLIKHKLLNNFRRAYVDVLSRQQSAFNGAILSALSHLAESCAALGQASTDATAQATQESTRKLLRRVLREQKRLRQELRDLAERIDALTAQEHG